MNEKNRIKEFERISLGNKKPSETFREYAIRKIGIDPELPVEGVSFPIEVCGNDNSHLPTVPTF